MIIEKFIFQDLSKINTLNNIECDNAIYETSDEYNIADTSIKDLDSDSEIKAEQVDLEEVNALSETDIEQIKLDSYNKGLIASREEFDKKVQELQVRFDFFSTIRNKLSDLQINVDINSDLLSLLITLIENIAKKLRVILPVDFHEIMKKELLEKVLNFYSQGEIICTVNSIKIEECTKIFELNQLPNEVRDRIKLVADDSLEQNDCIIHVNNSCFKYNQSLIESEAIKILEQLKN